MQTHIAIFLRLRNIVFLFYQGYIPLFLQNLRNLVHIIQKQTDNPHAYKIIQLLPCSFQICRQFFPHELGINALRRFYPAAYASHNFSAIFHGKLLIYDLRLRLHNADSILAKKIILVLFHGFSNIFNQLRFLHCSWFFFCLFRFPHILSASPS